ncbi:hypothetical protein BsWGS_23799 [Bradybaena similaris]
MRAVLCTLLLGLLCLQAEGIYRPRLCSLPKKPGPCFGFFPQYFYNSYTGACETFIYGGCDGNDNRFATIEECQATCGYYS